MAQRKPEENAKIQQVLKLVHELTAQEQQQLLEQLKFENLRREIQIGIDQADRGELISLEELNERLDATHAKLLERQKQKK
jgi:hypothetical protein